MKIKTEYSKCSLTWNGVELYNYIYKCDRKEGGIV